MERLNRERENLRGSEKPKKLLYIVKKYNVKTKEKMNFEFMQSKN